MKMQISVLLAATMLALSLPAAGNATALPEILFGKRYNDGVSVEQVSQHPPGHGSDLPVSVKYALRPAIQAAQAEVNADPKLREALQARGLRVKNVIKVETAANGGKIIWVK
ncbi:hypothetical protein [Allorhizobium taibaishanense]|uniref:Uncharacterized protein n=2 Tax=Allorhizobium taibaishanense TaxID=887144 RepID=A0A1Q9A3M9_9HYPH|nr:hypothetical protein [Allorhizobium taibaishanense]MBB4006136.1 hypothetical protein [Allorhizobium taibaishanense]OLP49132.1 hypothetical protein BJF91_18760 [Allorhizobium taibaishanense]